MINIAHNVRKIIKLTRYCSLTSEIEIYKPYNSTLVGEVSFKNIRFKSYFHYASTQQAVCDEGYTTDPTGKPDTATQITISCNENGKVVSDRKCYRIKCEEWPTANSEVHEEFNNLYLEDANFFADTPHQGCARYHKYKNVTTYNRTILLLGNQIQYNRTIVVITVVQFIKKVQNF